MKTILLFLLIIDFTAKAQNTSLLPNSIIAKGQNIKIYTNRKGEKITRIDNVGNKGGRAVFEYRGNIFLNDYYQLGRFTIKGGKTIEAPISYNLVSGQVFAQINNDEILINNSDFTIGEQHFISIKNSYYEVLYDGFIGKDTLSDKKIKILKKYACVLKKNEVQAYQVASPYDGELIRSETYVFQFPPNELRIFDMNAKSVKKVLVREKIATEKELSAKVIDIKSTDDLINLLKNL